MSATNPYDKPDRFIEKAQELKIKFDYYFLALIFATAALAVQTSEFGECWLLNLLELLGWAFLIMAGFKALRRMQSLPKKYFLLAKSSFTEEWATKAMQNNNDSSAIIEYSVKTLGEFKSTLDEMERQDLSQFRSQYRLFLFGLGCVAVARGGDALSDIIRRAWNIMETATLS